MKKKNGFTLIELLAVVVILAVIALISTPLIMNIIDGAQKGAFQNTAYGILEAGKYTYTNEVIKNGKSEFTEFTYEDGTESSNPVGKTLNYKGEKPKGGTILVDSKGDMAIAIYDGKYCAIKQFDELEVSVSQKTEANCTLARELTEVEVLVVAGGGPGGSNYDQSTGTAGGGGGAGGLIYSQSYAVTPGTPISVVVGSGGISEQVSLNTTNGQDSSFGTLVALGGGNGASKSCTAALGGSGGGGSYFHLVGGAGTTSQGFAGGTNPSSMYGGSGGGGGGAVGVSSSGNNGANGGNGLYFGDKFGNSFGDNGYFAGGGGGGARENVTTPGNGGLGGGGKGGTNSNGINGLPNTGGGGGGSAAAGYLGGNGGSGVILVRYRGAKSAEGGTITVLDGYTIHVFTSGTSTFTPMDL